MADYSRMVKNTSTTPAVHTVQDPMHRFEAEGFSAEEWGLFHADGLILRRNVFTPEEVQLLKACCLEFEAIAAARIGTVEGGFRETLAISPLFARLVCDRRLLGMAYDLYGEMTALHGFDLFIRPSGSLKEHTWHFDGPRRLPYSAFFPALPPVLKFGVWLTDVETAQTGAYQYMPGSHRQPCTQAYGESTHLDGQRTLQVRAGDVSIHHCDLWHRVSPNHGASTRYSFFIAYSPSWIIPREPFTEVDPQPALPELEPLLRRYADLTRRIKPPADEQPLHPRADAALMSGARLGEPPILSLIGQVET